MSTNTINTEPDETVTSKTFAVGGLLSLNWYGTEVEVLIDGKPVPLIEWLQHHEGHMVVIGTRDIEPNK